MAVQDIVSTDDICVWLGLPDSEGLADRNLLIRIKELVTVSVRNYCRHNLNQPDADYVHLLPSTFDANTAVLQLPQPFVRSITEIREDANARGGQGSSDFPTSSILTAGSDYWLDEDESGLSRSGMVYRENKDWPDRPRTVKVTYLAGATAAELADGGEFADLKQLILEEMVYKYARQKAVQVQSERGDPGPLITEKLGDWMAQYASEKDNERSKGGYDTGLSKRMTDYLDANGWVNEGVLR